MAVTVLQAIISEQIIVPTPLFKSIKMDVAAKKQKGSKLYPRLLAQVNKSTYWPYLLIRLIIIYNPMQPVSPNPYMLPNSSLPFKVRRIPKRMATNIGPFISSY